FFVLNLGLSVLAHYYAKSHPVLITALFIGIGVGYCGVLIPMIFWANRVQRRIRVEEGSDSDVMRSATGAPISRRAFEYRSRASFLGLPLIHVRLECIQAGKML